MILPGFATHPVRMRYLARQLESAGHITKRWGLGRNWGPDPGRFDLIEERLLQLHARHARKVVLIGWSLGGLYARELAKRQPGSVAKVITMGSPFSGSPRANNAWRAYQFITGHSVDAPPVAAELAVKPPVETVALWSANDGVIGPRCAAGRACTARWAMPTSPACWAAALPACSAPSWPTAAWRRSWDSARSPRPGW